MSSREKHKTQIDLASISAQFKAAESNGNQQGSPKDFPAPKRLRKIEPMRSTKQRNEPPPSPARDPSRAHSSPWSHYTKLFTLQYGNSDFFTVAERADVHSSENAVFVIKTISESAGNNHVELMQRIKRVQHERFVKVEECFGAEGKLFAVFQCMPLSLSEIAMHPLLNEIRLASVLGQILQGLIYLEKNSSTHGHLTCSNILIDTSGYVRLWGQEYCHASSDMKKDVQALGTITMEMVQGHAKEDRNVGLDHPGNWPLAMEFLSATGCTSKPSTLATQQLLQLDWDRRHVAGMAFLCSIWASRGYRFPA